MPELPEVETVARGLQISVAGRRIVSVTLRKTDFMDDPDTIEREVPGTQIARVERFGKFMLLRLVRDRAASEPEASSKALLVHLGMTGNLAPHFAEQPRELRYTDARRFGRMAYLAGETLAAELLRFGADPLEVTAEEFAKRIESSRARIKALLLDQTVLRGVGNIYADESLWSAGIHPAKSGAKLKRKELARLRQALQKILRKAIQMRGSSISDFVDAEGQPGDYQQHHRAYGREGKKCFRCGRAIKRIIIAGRSSYFCPACQRAPHREGRIRKSTKRKGRARTSKR
ncbi:MAG: bifunctional DNA-formamidopyrimidine glycosylase/DNA-(apurinic or apyrimidinic site) lyase [Acidobacteria bacterium]|nr:MAG: bifunctional DNA-formamidopyrimidine glycosylase/DNA-(apurinic or apyrimidinic site) lyase [Acidobacteriota bacterium]